MKTPMKRTVFRVILRKSEYKEQWSLLIESFLVFEPGKDKPQKTLRNTAGTYTIEIDANIIDHLPQLEEKVLGKNHP